MLYQEYLLLIQLIEMIDEKRKLCEQEAIKYKKKIEQNPNYRMIYYTERGFAD